MARGNGGNRLRCLREVSGLCVQIDMKSDSLKTNTTWDMQLETLPKKNKLFAYLFIYLFILPLIYSSAAF